LQSSVKSRHKESFRTARDVEPKLVLTTGTAGGIGPDCKVGDVVVSPIVTFDCQNWLKNEPFHDSSFKAPLPNAKFFKKVQSPFRANAADC